MGQVFLWSSRSQGGGGEGGQVGAGEGEKGNIWTHRCPRQTRKKRSQGKGQSRGVQEPSEDQPQESQSKGQGESKGQGAKAKLQSEKDKENEFEGVPKEDPKPGIARKRKSQNDDEPEVDGVLKEDPKPRATRKRKSQNDDTNSLDYEFPKLLHTQFSVYWSKNAVGLKLKNVDVDCGKQAQLRNPRVMTLLFFKPADYNKLNAFPCQVIYLAKSQCVHEGSLGLRCAMCHTSLNYVMFLHGVCIAAAW